MTVSATSRWACQPRSSCATDDRFHTATPCGDRTSTSIARGDARRFDQLEFSSSGGMLARRVASTARVVPPMRPRTTCATRPSAVSSPAASGAPHRIDRERTHVTSLALRRSLRRRAPAPPQFAHSAHPLTDSRVRLSRPSRREMGAGAAGPARCLCGWMRRGLTAVMRTVHRSTWSGVAAQLRTAAAHCGGAPPLRPPRRAERACRRDGRVQGSQPGAAGDGARDHPRGRPGDAAGHWQAAGAAPAAPLRMSAVPRLCLPAVGDQGACACVVVGWAPGRLVNTSLRSATVSSSQFRSGEL